MCSKWEDEDVGEPMTKRRQDTIGPRCLGGSASRAALSSGSTNSSTNVASVGSRISRDQMLLEIAKAVAMRSTCDRAKVGAVVAREGRVISTGYGGAPAGLPHCSEVGCEVEGGHC